MIRTAARALAQAMPEVPNPGASSAGDVFLSILPYAVGIVGITIVGGIIMMISRRKIDTSAASGPIGFTLADLKTLRDTGELSEAEYDRARGEVIARARKAFRSDSDGPPVR